TTPGAAHLRPCAAARNSRRLRSRGISERLGASLRGLALAGVQGFMQPVPITCPVTLLRPCARVAGAGRPGRGYTVPVLSIPLFRSGLRRNRSGGQPLASARPAGGEHLAPALGRHARTETVAVLADEFARLIGPFHVSSPADLAPGSDPVNSRRGREEAETPAVSAASR